MSTMTYDPELRELRERAGRIYRQAHASGLTGRPGLDDDVAALARWSLDHPVRSGAALSAWLTSVSVEEAFAAAELDAFDTYMKERRAGASHSDAMAVAEATHVHRFTTTVNDGRCPVLNTGTVVTVRRCDGCGTEFRDERRYNYSGD